VLHTAVTSAPHAGQLHGECADTTHGAVDQDPLSGLELPRVAQSAQRGQSRRRQRRGLLEREALGLQRQLGLGRAGVLGTTAVGDTEHLVARAELGHVFADRFHLPGDVEAGNPTFRFEQARSQAHEQRCAADAEAVADVQGGSANAHQHFVVLEARPVDGLERQDVGSAVPLVHDSLHRRLWRARRGAGLVGPTGCGHWA
jgi:hypothetical protein